MDEQQIGELIRSKRKAMEENLLLAEEILKARINSIGKARENSIVERI